jgi:hypothetical protein
MRAASMLFEEGPSELRLRSNRMAVAPIITTNKNIQVELTTE